LSRKGAKSRRRISRLRSKTTKARTDVDRIHKPRAERIHGLAVTAYCPLARGKVPGNDVLARIGKAYGKTSAQIALRYLVQQGIIPIPRTAKPDRLAANLAVFDFNLSDAEMAEIARLKQTGLRILNPPHAPRWNN
jgi:2,5-diketo-D-gluconate reductase B